MRVTKVIRIAVCRVNMKASTINKYRSGLKSKCNKIPHYA